MKLWIRSQNKCKLREAECIYYYYEAGKHIIDCNGYPCGVYESKKRCLEIIDEIQELLKLGNPENAFFHIHNCDMGYDETIEVLKRARETKAIITQGTDFDIKLPSVVVYEMPEK